MENPTVVLLPIWGQGHFMPMIEAGKRLLGCRSSRALLVTVLIMPAPTAQLASEIADHIRREEAAGLDIRFHHLPAVKPPTEVHYTGPEEFMAHVMQRYATHVKAAISGLTCPVAALVIDIFCTPMLDVSHELAVPAYVYFTCSAGMLAVLLRSPALHEEVTVEFEEMDGAVGVPELPPLPPPILPSGMVDRKKPTYTWFVYNGRRYMEANGIIINTMAELEPAILASIADGRCTRGIPAPTVYPIGPVLSLIPPAEQPHECVRWLDSQPPASVVLLCLGGGGFSTTPQAHEIAHGLERSGHRFLWVLRAPPAYGTKQPTDANLAELLPEGFFGKTKERGLVWPKRAPQKEILAHAAVGGFITHCGWNSILESMWFGVPMVPWPLGGEQHFNAFRLVSEMGVAVEMKVERKTNNFVDASELERAVKVLMGGGDEGRKAREKAKEIKAMCRKAVEDGGSSNASLQTLSEALHEGAVLPKR